MSGRFPAALLLALPLLGAQQPPVSIEPRPVHPWVAACEDWDDWDKAGPPFNIFGNTWYVGTCGISAILITADDGHVLIDSGTEAGADIILANIRSLGFDPGDVKLLLNSHEHFDHVGGMAKLQEATGAQIVSSAIGAETMLSGKDHPDDPQFGMHPPMRPVRSALPFYEGEGQWLLHKYRMWPIPTPGHTPGAMSWTWRACDGSECRTVVYADSLSAVSSDAYRFTDHAEYLSKFFTSLKRVADARCDLVLTPHPSGSQMRGKLMGGDLSAPGANSCEGYMRSQRGSLFARLLREDPEWMQKNLPQGVQ